jgi:hypothetical protein
MSGQVEDKKGNPINEGDTVFTKIRGGKREGEVSTKSPADCQGILLVDGPTNRGPSSPCT